MKKTIGPALALFALLCVVVHCVGCKQGFAAAELLARKTQCALQYRDLPNEEILAKCAIDPRDAKNILDIVGQEREHDAKLMRVGCSADAGF